MLQIELFKGVCLKGPFPERGCRGPWGSAAAPWDEGRCWEEQLCREPTRAPRRGLQWGAASPRRPHRGSWGRGPNPCPPCRLLRGSPWAERPENQDAERPVMNSIHVRTEGGREGVKRGQERHGGANRGGLA